jgi:hypothetical protein
MPEPGPPLTFHPLLFQTMVLPTLRVKLLQLALPYLPPPNNLRADSGGRLIVPSLLQHRSNVRLQQRFALRHLLPQLINTIDYFALWALASATRRAVQELDVMTCATTCKLPLRSLGSSSGRYFESVFCRKTTRFSVGWMPATRSFATRGLDACCAQLCNAWAGCLLRAALQRVP